MDEIKTLYHNLKNLSNITYEEISELKDFFKKEVYPAKKIIFREGDNYLKVSFILEGILKKFYLTHDGQEFIKEFSTKGDIVAPYSSLLQKKPASFSMQTLEKTILLTIDFLKIEELFSKNIKWMRLGKKIAEIHFINRELREEELLKYSAKDRLEFFKKRNPELILKLKKKDIAAYLGITPVSLSRLKGN